MSTGKLQPYRVTVALPRTPGDGALVPPDAQVLAEAAVAAIAANDLMTAWTSDRALLPMVIKSPCQAGALSAGRAVAQAMGGGQGATIVTLAFP